jgi:hypothetical protein
LFRPDLPTTMTMGTKRLAMGVIAAVMAAGTTTGAAASLGLSSGQFGAAGTTVAACDSNGFTPSYTTAAGNVTVVTLSGIADACEGGSLSLTLTNGNASVASAGPQVVPADADAADTSVAVPVSPAPAGQVNGVHAVITGP